VQDHLNSDQFEAQARSHFSAADKALGGTGLLDPRAMEPIVRALVPETYLGVLLGGSGGGQVSSEKLVELVLSFDMNEDGKISQEEFDDFLRWIYVMTAKKYFETKLVSGDHQ
jgi:Ca2+-binding EF-hand superfamily protein